MGFRSNQASQALRQCVESHSHRSIGALVLIHVKPQSSHREAQVGALFCQPFAQIGTGAATIGGLSALCSRLPIRSHRRFS